jgi:hypothetical protein
MWIDERRGMSMNIQQMQPLTAKELEYIVDSMSNEDLLIKQCVIAAATSQNPTVQQLCQHLVQTHQQHYQTLMNSLNQHTNFAPQQPTI